MIPSDHFVRFYNEVFKFLDEKNGLEKLMDVMALAGELDKRADYNMIVNTTFAQQAVQNIQK